MGNTMKFIFITLFALVAVHASDATSPPSTPPRTGPRGGRSDPPAGPNRRVEDHTLARRNTAGAARRITTSELNNAGMRDDLDAIVLDAQRRAQQARAAAQFQRQAAARRAATRLLNQRER